MSRQQSTDVVSVSFTPRRSKVSAITDLGLSEDDYQNLDPSSGLHARSGQHYASSEDHSEIEMHTMDHTHSEIEVSTSNKGNGRITTEERESLISPIQKKVTHSRGGWHRNS